jgi:threonyl-tRNA synthetase
MGIRPEVDCRDEKLGYRIREARLDKVPYIIILGEKEQANGSVSVRMRDAEIDKQDLGEMSVDEFVKLVNA